MDAALKRSRSEEPAELPPAARDLQEEEEAGIEQELEKEKRSGKACGEGGWELGLGGWVKIGKEEQRTWYEQGVGGVCNNE